MTRAVVYARLSRDRDGSQTATARQIPDRRKFGDAKGWRVGPSMRMPTSRPIPSGDPPRL